MPRRSTRENKTAYQLSREHAGLTREAAAERMEFISAARIEKIESERSAPHPEEVLAMAEAYGDPMLRNEYCTRECPIGKKYVPRRWLRKNGVKYVLKTGYYVIGGPDRLAYIKNIARGIRDGIRGDRS